MSAFENIIQQLKIDPLGITPEDITALEKGIRRLSMYDESLNPYLTRYSVINGKITLPKETMRRIKNLMSVTNTTYEELAQVTNESITNICKKINGTRPIKHFDYKDIVNYLFKRLRENNNGKRNN